MNEKNTGKTPLLKNKKSERLNKPELHAFRSYVIERGSQAEAARVLGTTRQMVSLLFRFGSASPATIAKIREKLNVPQ